MVQIILGFRPNLQLKLSVLTRFRAAVQTMLRVASSEMIEKHNKHEQFANNIWRLTTRGQFIP